MNHTKLENQVVNFGYTKKLAFAIVSEFVRSGDRCAKQLKFDDEQIELHYDGKAKKLECEGRYPRKSRPRQKS